MPRSIDIELHNDAGRVKGFVILAGWSPARTFAGALRKNRLCIVYQETGLEGTDVDTTTYVLTEQREFEEEDSVSVDVAWKGQDSIVMSFDVYVQDVNDPTGRNGVSGAYRPGVGIGRSGAVEIALSDADGSLQGAHNDLPGGLL